MAFKGEYLRTEATGWPFKDPENLISQPSMFLGTQASKRTWPRTLCALMRGGLGEWDDLSLRSSCKEPASPPVWCSAELGKKKWSFGPRATLLRLWFESTAALWRSQIKSEISSCIPSRPNLSMYFSVFSVKTETAFWSNPVTAAWYRNGHCL